MAQGVKTINKEKFYIAYDKFLLGEFSITQSAKFIGISSPTVVKYFNKVYLGEELPDTLFESKKRKTKQKKKGK